MNRKCKALFHKRNGELQGILQSFVMTNYETGTEVRKREERTKGRRETKKPKVKENRLCIYTYMHTETDFDAIDIAIMFSGKI